MTAFSASYDEVIAAPRGCFVMRVVGLEPSVTTIPLPPRSVFAAAEQSVPIMNRAFRCLIIERYEVVPSWEPRCARLSAFTLTLLDSSQGQEKLESIGALSASFAGNLLVVACAADR